MRIRTGSLGMPVGAQRVPVQIGGKIARTACKAVELSRRFDDKPVPALISPRGQVAGGDTQRLQELAVLTAEHLVNRGHPNDRRGIGTRLKQSGELED